MNAIVFGRDKGEKSEDFCLLGRYICQGILFICSHITVVMVSPLCWLFSSFTDDKDDTASCHCTWYIYHYIVAIHRFYQCELYVAWCTSRSKITLEVTTLFFVKWQVISLYRSLKRENNLLDDISSEQAVVFWFLPLLPQKLLRSFLLEPKHRKKKYCHIPDVAWERI